MKNPEATPTYIPTPQMKIRRYITCFGHADAAVDNGESLVSFVRNETNKELRLRVELALIGQTLESDLIQSIGGVADQLAEEYLLIAVECVDDQAEELVDLRLECERLRVGHLHFRHRYHR